MRAPMAGSLRLRFETREAFARVWAESLSRGAVFVHVAEPPRLQARVVVELELAFAGSKARLEGEVVHHVPASAGGEAGVAVELLAPLAKIREAFGRYADEEGAAPAKPAPPRPAAGAAPARAAGAAAAATPPVRPAAPAGDDGLFDDDALFEPDAAAAADDALDLDDVVPEAPAAGADDDLDISDEELASLVGEAGAPTPAAPSKAPAARPAPPKAPASAPEAPATRTLAPLPLDPNDPLASLDPGALELSDADPLPETELEALPHDGVPYDPHERELP